jgi:hypothetical protein
MVGNVKELKGKHTFDELVDRDAAARFLEVSPRTLDRWHLLREGPPRIRYGRIVRYRLSAIMDWLNAHETSSLDSTFGDSRSAAPLAVSCRIASPPMPAITLVAGVNYSNKEGHP